jgi:hypothetical protein
VHRPVTSRATSFTIFGPRGINFANVVYFECVHVDSRLALGQLLGTTEGNMAKKAKKAKKKTAKKKKK